MKTQAIKNETEMFYEVNLLMIEFDKDGLVKTTSNKSYYFPFHSSKKIIDARKCAIAKAKELLLELNHDKSFDHPLVAKHKKYKGTKGFSVSVNLTYDVLQYQIFGGNEPLEELACEAAFLLGLGVKCQVIEINDSDNKPIEILRDDLEFTIM